MRKEEVIAFARRDWRAIAEIKRRRWAEQKSRMTPAEALRVGDELRHHVRSLHSSWPTEEDRQEDLVVHLRVSESLRRVAPSRAISVDVEGTLVPVISPEDLIVTKVLAERPKDVEDIRGVLHERRESLDVERIRAVPGSS